MVIARMPPDERASLIALLEKYQQVQGDLALAEGPDGVALLV